jgi:hypothetical protein
MSEHLPPPSRDGTVVLDIGVGVGALVVHTDPELDGVEIDISPEAGGRRTHVAVRERRVAGGSRWAAVYPSLTAGRYTLHGVAGTGDRSVSIVAGQVNEVDW